MNPPGLRVSQVLSPLFACYHTRLIRDERLSQAHGRNRRGIFLHLRIKIKRTIGNPIQSAVLALSILYCLCPRAQWASSICLSCQRSVLVVAHALPSQSKCSCCQTLFENCNTLQLRVYVAFNNCTAVPYLDDDVLRSANRTRRLDEASLLSDL